MSKAKLQNLVQSVNKVNLENRKRPEVAKAASKEIIDSYIQESGVSREHLIDKFQTKLEDNPTSTYYISIIEMLKQYV